MKKNFRYCSSVIALGTLMFFAGCSNSTKPQQEGGKTESVKVDSLPSQPKDQQKYVDSNGNQWAFNALLGAWCLSNSMNNGASYYYYPSTGTYTDQDKNAVTPPASVSSGISNGVKARTEPVTVTRSTSSSSSVKSTSSTTNNRKSVFGSSARSKSVGA